MSEHTPGPWKAREAKAGGYWCVEDAQGDILTRGGCGCCSDPDDSIENKADARLIATAPDLEDSLAWIVAFCDEHSEWFGDENGAEHEWRENARVLLAKIRNVPIAEAAR